MLALVRCGTHPPTPADCDTTDLAIHIEGTSNPTACDVLDGSISVDALGGKEPYTFALNEGAFGATTTFQGLSAGTYEVFVTDGNNCVRSAEVVLSVPESNLDMEIASSVSGCGTGNGSVTVTGTGGDQPYSYKLNSGTFGSSGTFGNLPAGTYTVTVKDAHDCTLSQRVSVVSGVSYKSQIELIIKTNCALSTCHNGDVANLPDYTVFANVKAHASQIKEFTADRIMPPSGKTPLSKEQISLIGCWVDDGANNN